MLLKQFAFESDASTSVRRSASSDGSSNSSSSLPGNMLMSISSSQSWITRLLVSLISGYRSVQCVRVEHSEIKLSNHGWLYLHTQNYKGTAHLCHYGVSLDNEYRYYVPSSHNGLMMYIEPNECIANITIGRWNTWPVVDTDGKSHVAKMPNAQVSRMFSHLVSFRIPLCLLLV